MTTHAPISPTSPIRRYDPSRGLKAIPASQSGKRLYVGVANAGDLVRYTKVDPYNSNLAPDDPNQGYQRPPERSRITRIGSYLIHNGSSTLFPTAVLLAARHELEYNPTRSEVVLYPDEPLQVVDGQHRIAGLRYAIEEKNRADLAELEIPFVIMEEPDRIEEMNQFRVVNGTAKSVRTDLVNAILTATAAARGEEAIKDSDRWKVVATRAIDTLNKEPNSPWYGLILMPDDAGSPNSKDGTGKIVRATSFMTSIKPVYEFLRKFNFLTKCNNTEEEAAEVYKVLASYWKALQLVVPEPFEEPNKHVIQKTPGLFSLHKLLVADLLPNMFRGHREWTTENFVEFLQDSPEITEANFWHIAGGHASSYGSMKGFDELYKLLSYSVEPKP